MRLYADLAPWYDLIDPRADHADEAAAYLDALAAAGLTGGELLELGAGAGNNASFMKARFRCVLTDLSPAMLALSSAANPECEHVLGDMRMLDVGRTFDAVLVHDAIVYMTSLADLRAVLANAWRHLRAGGVAVFAPDALRDDFHERTSLLEGEADGRAVRGLAWCYDPEPGDTTCVTDYVFMLRAGGSVTMVHDHHVEGLFTRAEWDALLAEVGFEVATASRPGDDDHPDLVFVVRRPG